MILCYKYYIHVKNIFKITEQCQDILTWKQYLQVFLLNHIFMMLIYNQRQASFRHNQRCKIFPLNQFHVLLTWIDIKRVLQIIRSLILIHKVQSLKVGICPLQVCLSFSKEHGFLFQIIGDFKDCFASPYLIYTNNFKFCIALILILV